MSGGCLAGGRAAEADLMNVIGAASDYPNTPLLASDINTNPTPEKRDNSNGIELDLSMALTKFVG